MGIAINDTAASTLGNVSKDQETALANLVDNINDPKKAAQALKDVTDAGTKMNNLGKALATKQRSDDVARSLA